MLNTNVPKQLYGTASGVRAEKHTLASIVPELDNAVEELAATVRRLEQEEADLTEAIQQTVGSLSDLRYGRLANGQLREQVLEGLETVQETCQSRT